MANKVTMKEQFNALIELAIENGRPDLADFCKGRIALIDKKNAKSTTLSENIKLAEITFDTMEVGKVYRCSELAKIVPNISSSSKMTAILNILVEQGIVKRAVEKGVSYYTIANYTLIDEEVED